MSSNTTSSPQKPEIADIFRRHAHKLSCLHPTQASLIDNITSCRTAALGGHLLKCDNCDYSEISYNSCRGRHCPKCQCLAGARWIEQRKGELLPVQYFHVVFTISDKLNPVALYNKSVVYNILFTAAAETLKEVAANPDNLGARIGFIALLHTWDQKLNFHPHIHCVGPGGGLSPEKSAWISSPENYCLPVKILSAVFRGKFLSSLEKAFCSQKLQFPSASAHLNDKATFKQLLKESCSTDWVVYSKRPFANAERVLRYLGRYTHRVAISNSRIDSLTDKSVTFSFKDRKHGSKVKSMTLDVLLFMQRFLLHILPKRFVRIRSYGFLANPSKKESIALCRELLGGKEKNSPDQEDLPDSWQEWMLFLTGSDPSLCPCCGKGHLEIHSEIPRLKAG